MKTLNRIFALIFAVVLAFSGVGFQEDAEAQSIPPITTLSAALAAGSTSTAVTVASNTGITANTFSCLIEHEQVAVTATSGTTSLTVRRAQLGNAVAHPSGSFVMCGPTAGRWNVSDGSSTGLFMSSPPTGTCPGNSNNQYLPVIVTGNANPKSWQMSNCNNGRWVDQTLLDDVPPTILRYCAPPGLGSLAVFTTFGDANSPIVIGTNTTPVAGRLYYGTIEIPRTMRLTGMSILNGTVAGTDKINLALYRADGVGPLAKTLAGGTTAAGGIDRFQDIDFTATYVATGPARYWVLAQVNGTTTRIRTINLSPGATTAGLGAFIGMLGSFLPSVTFDVLPSALATGAAGASTPATALPTSLINASTAISCVY